MKKALLAKHRLKAKSVDDYLAQVPEPARTSLKKVRATVWSIAPPETTEGISYGIPMFKYQGMLFGYAAFKNHCSLFPTSLAVMNTFKEDLKHYDISKGTIRFPLEKPPSATLIKKLVKARLAEKKRKQSR